MFLCSFPCACSFFLPLLSCLLTCFSSSFSTRTELGEWVRAQELCTYSLLFSEAAGLSLSMGRCYWVKFRLALTEGKMDVALQFAQLACRQPNDVSTWVDIMGQVVHCLLEQQEFRQIREVLFFFVSPSSLFFLVFAYQKFV